MGDQAPRRFLTRITTLVSQCSLQYCSSKSWSVILRRVKSAMLPFSYWRKTAPLPASLGSSDSLASLGPSDSLGCRSDRCRPGSPAAGRCPNRTRARARRSSTRRSPRPARRSGADGAVRTCSSTSSTPGPGCPRHRSGDRCRWPPRAARRPARPAPRP